MRKPRPLDPAAPPAEAALARIERDSAGLFGLTFARLITFVKGKDATAGDAVELWGRRVGRALALLAVAALAINLCTHWFF